MKKTSILQLSTILTILFLSIACGHRQQENNGESSTAIIAKDSLPLSTAVQDSVRSDSLSKAGPAFDISTISEDPLFEINTTAGTILVQLYKETPLHRDNFVKLASERYFDSTLFHRVIRGFMIQGGDPLTKDSSNYEYFGTGGPGYTIPAEILPQFTHKKGALCAARKGDAANPKKSSAGSQFYLVQEPENCQHLDGEYTIFGETIDGFDVIDRIARVRTDKRDIPLKPVMILSVIPL